jgi:AcrR family transcriptional regulator
MTVSNRKIQQARQTWRMCAAAEVAFAKLGRGTTVADILKAAGMSRRSFYEMFGKIEDIVRLSVEHRRATGLGPSLEFMALAYAPSRETHIDANAAFAAARAAAERGEPLPAPGVEELLAWYDQTPLPTVESKDAQPAQDSEGASAEASQ